MRRQLDGERNERAGGEHDDGRIDRGDGHGSGGGPGGGNPWPREALPTRFYASAALDAGRVGRDSGVIADELLSLISGVPGARLRVSLEIEADFPGKASEKVQLDVTENTNQLKFESHGFTAEWSTGRTERGRATDDAGL